MIHVFLILIAAHFSGGPVVIERPVASIEMCAVEVKDRLTEVLPAADGVKYLAAMCVVRSIPAQKS